MKIAFGVALIVVASGLIRVGSTEPPRAKWSLALRRFDCPANTSRWIDDTGVYCTPDSHVGEDDLPNAPRTSVCPDTNRADVGCIPDTHADTNHTPVQIQADSVNPFELAIHCLNGGDPTTLPELHNGALVVSCGNDVSK